MVLQLSSSPGPALPNCCCLERAFLLTRVTSAGNGTCDFPGTVLLPDTASEGWWPSDELLQEQLHLLYQRNTLKQSLYNALGFLKECLQGVTLYEL